MKHVNKFRLIILLISIGVVIPVILYWFFYLRVPTITPEEARELMAEDIDTTVLIDVRTKEEYEKFSLKAAVNIPLDDIHSADLKNWQQVLDKKKNFLLICNMGYLSARAVDGLNRLGYKNIFSVRGGMDSWLAHGKITSGGGPEIKVRANGCEMNGVRPISFSLFEQLIICIAAFGLKPLYEIMSLIIVIFLWKSIEPDLAALRRGMIAFFLGENACAINYLFFNEKNILLEFLHTYGMLVSFGLVVYAFMKAMDIRILHFSDKKNKCALLNLCNKCYKYETVPCNLRLLFLYVILATLVITFLPLTADTGSYFYAGKIFKEFVIFGHYSYQQSLEVRLYPLAALLFISISLIILIIKKEDGLENSKIFFAMGIGPLSFSLVRFFAFWGFSNNPLWAEAWEEITEFLFILFIMWIIIRIRHTKKIAQVS